jgi:glyoxylase-like metal-dependent hydrolase (beta-lactamase superfamily II)
MPSAISMNVQHFFEPETSSLTYVVFDPESGDAVVIDAVLDFDLVAVKTCTRSVDKVCDFLRDKRLTLRHVLETHAHADHLSAAQVLKRRFNVPLGIGENITTVQKTFAAIFDLGPDFATDGSQFDRLIRDGETFFAGSLAITAIATPGHTPACMTYRIGDALFVGDSLFIEDYGTGRCDFPGGDADRLYESVTTRLYALPETTRIFVGHDYQPGGRPLRYETTVSASRQKNAHLRDETARDAFVCFRRTRDATLSPPRLLYPSVQVNIDAGRMPSCRPSGQRFLRLPLNCQLLTRDDGSLETDK